MSQREKITFELNVPAVVQLSFDDGKEVPGRDGAQWQYFLEEEKIMWVNPEVRDKIRAIPAVAGDVIEITKVKRGKMAAWWTVALVNVEEEPAPEDQAAWNARMEQRQANREQVARAKAAQPAPAAMAPPVNGTALTGADYARARATVQNIDQSHGSRNHSSHGAANGAAPTAPQPAPARPDPPAQPSQFAGSLPKGNTSNGEGPKPAAPSPTQQLADKLDRAGFNGSTHSGVHNMPAPQPETGNRKPETEVPRRITPATAQLAAALMAAIDAGLEAQEYAKRKGITLEFGPGDFRAMANTIQINGGGAR